MIMRDSEATQNTRLADIGNTREIEPPAPRTYSASSAPSRGVDAATAAGIQTLLRAHGYYQGQVTDAIKAAQRDLGLPVTGQVTPMLVTGLQQRPEVAQKASPLGDAISKVPPQVKNLGKLLLGAAGITGLVYFLSQKRQAVAMAESYDDTVEPEDGTEEQDELIEGEACPYKGESRAAVEDANEDDDDSDDDEDSEESSSDDDPKEK